MWTAKVLRAVCLGCLLVAGAQPTYAKRIPRWWMKVAQRQGPNACVVEEVPNTGLEFWTECRYWLNRKICGRRTRIRFECCEGFERNGDENGCTRVKPLMNLLETAESLGATKWAQYIRESGLAGELEGAAAYTLFAPTNEAFENLRRSLKSQMEAYRGNPNNPILLYHMLPTKLLSDNFQADMMAETRYQGHSVRVNKYSNGMTTINCALLIRKDQHATNGVVHLISNVLDPSIGIGRNVVDIVLGVSQGLCLHLTSLSSFFSSFLVDSPCNFFPLSLTALIQNHIIPHVICESAVTGEHRVTTTSKDKLMFSCDIDGTYVETTKMRGNFNLGQNGIIHMIDDVLLPDRAKNLLELAESRQLFTFVELVKKAGLEETLSHTGDYTFFVPDEAAWYDSSFSPPVILTSTLTINTTTTTTFTSLHNFLLPQAIMSLNEEDPVRLQVWRRSLGVEDAQITLPDLEAQNGVIHIINKVIMPSNQSLADVLRSLPGHSFETFLEAVDRVSQEGEAGTLLSLGPGDEMFYTFFVPTDRAFRRVNQAMLRRLRQDEAFTRRVVRQHVAVNMFPEISFEKNLVYTVNGMAGPFDVKKTKDDILKVNGEEVVSSHLCANGVIHVINKAFMPESYTSTVQHETYGETEGMLGFPLPSRTSNSRTYKVSFAKRYNGLNQDLSGVAQGTSDDSMPARASGRKTVKRGRGGGSFGTSSSSTTLPPPAAVSLTSIPALSSPTSKDTVEDTHLESTRHDALEDEVSANTLSASSEGPRDPNDELVHYNEPGLRDGHGSRPRYPKGSFSIKDGFHSSTSYDPSVTTSSTITSTVTSSSHSTSIHGVQEDAEELKEKQLVDSGQRGAGGRGEGGERDSLDTSHRTYHPDLYGSSFPESTSKRPYDSDLDRGSSTSSSKSRRRYDPDLDSSMLRRENDPDRNEDSSSSTSSSSTSRRRYDPVLDRYNTDLDRNHSSLSSSSSSSISSFESTSHRRYNPNFNNSNRNLSSSSSFDSYTPRRRYDSGVNRGSSSSSSSSSSTSRRRYSPDLDHGSISTSSSSFSRHHEPDVDTGHSTSSSFSIEHSTTRTRFESPSGNSSPLAVPPRLPGGQDSASRSFHTNYTRYSSQDRSTSHSQSTSTTDMAGSTTTLERSNTDLRDVAANRRDFGSSLSRPRTDETEVSIDSSRTNIRGSTTDVRGSTTGVRDSSPDIRSSGIELRSDGNIRDSNIDLRGSSDSKNSVNDSRRTDTVIKGSSTNRRVSNTNTNLRGSNSGVRESNTILKGSTTELRGSGRATGSSGPTMQREMDTHVGDISNVGASSGYTTTSSRIYSYEYSGGTGGHDPYSKPSTSSPSLRPSPSARDSTARPTTTGGRRFSYVGHRYGQDVVGHTNQLSEIPRPSPLPYHLGTEGHGIYGREVAGIRSLGEESGSVRALEGGVSGGGEGVGKSVYKYSKTSHVQQHLHGPHALQPRTNMHSASSGRSTTTIGSVRSSTKRRYNITKTSYSYSVPVLSSRFPPPIRSGDNKLGSLSPVSAYAFTGDDDMYADGTEFAELKGVGLESMTRQEARELRRRFRKKRHHKRRGSAKGRRRRGRRGRRNQSHQKTTKVEA
ncbi:serine-rich adhesin for platelets-like [Portunus trituberculatus]|uniref:serine-rich adhesin for platelets-like n=1 Tax=Portunus trituberculatus TaxID=210409 RepID=UPI001E1CF3D2|nr:serine-rich adhesin for platelets-like [Portunus trituberculatus]